MALRAVDLRRFLLRGEAGTLPLPLAWRARPASTAACDDELAGKGSYEVLRVGETSSYPEIKASFHRLAKETHHDVAAAAGSFRSSRPTRSYRIHRKGLITIATCVRRAGLCRAVRCLS